MSAASNESASEATASPGPIIHPKRIRWGGIIFFKVEETVFEAPRYRFAKHSEVFETMFHLPAGSDGTAEGQDEEHPILLEGYKAVHFNSLLKVLYPTPEDFISGTLQLEKEEWIGVLNLSTRWSMKKIREHAISELSKASLNPMEKIVLGRDHKVAKWFREGLTELVSENPIRPLAELKAQLGAEMACSLLWIRDQTQTILEPGLTLTGLSLGMIGCYYCQAGMFQTGSNCVSCSRTIAVDDCSAICMFGGSCDMYIHAENPATGPATATVCINLQSLMCRGCSKCAFSLENRTCPSCSRAIGYRAFKLRLGKSVIKNSSASQKILEEFGEEIARYESWDE
ncbi:hypothetical protein EST38_g11253 [Candolleomyces aberdarensis]|uniref:BTB domain-containing protein n=1 Tax=Candolleomyces aberdarensis TaxID=2316362 RepID=A0A4Q2D5C3_9AGAR|nr:hypothetical protein EST38_g11253 [Candolleomyces aberdarensis]